jgi:hypothetical protein
MRWHSRPNDAPGPDPDRLIHVAVLTTYPANGDQQSQLAIDTLPVAHGGNP